MNGITFVDKQKAAFRRAGNHVAQWLIDKDIQCHEIYFDKKVISPEKDYFKYVIRVADTYTGRTYIFDMTCKGNRLELSHVATSQNPRHLLPGDMVLRMSEATSQFRVSSTPW